MNTPTSTPPRTAIPSDPPVPLTPPHPRPPPTPPPPSPHAKPSTAIPCSHVRAANRLTHTIVSSDCPEILALAERAGFDTLRRPDELATSEASVQDVLLHAMDHVEQRDNIRFDAVLTLYGNCPIRPA